MDNPSFNQNGIEYNGEQIAYKDSTYELVSKVGRLPDRRPASYFPK